MARSEEKAQSMLNKWWSMKRGLYLRDPDEPPPLVSDCHSLTECYRWREQIIKEIGDKVAEIQNAGLGEFRIRALNDEINQLLNNKRQWEDRIKQLGGQDYRKREQRYYDADGQELPGSGGYRYFGAAKDLPGVRELFFTETPVAPARDLKSLYQKVPHSYFEFDSKALELRKKEEQEQQNRTAEFREKNRAILEQMRPGFGQMESEAQAQFMNTLDYQRFLELKFHKKQLNVGEVAEKILKNEEKEQKELQEMKKRVFDLYLKGGPEEKQKTVEEQKKQIDNKIREEQDKALQEMYEVDGN